MHATVVHQQSDGPVYIPGELRDARPALVSQAQLSQMQQRFAARTSASPPGQLFNQSSVGILVVAKQRQLLSTYVNLRVLREHLRCTLPVEVIWHGPSEAPPEPLQKAVASLPGVRLVDSSKVTLPEPWAALGLGLPEEMSFRAKAWALAFATSFTHVLLLDSDNLPLVDPRPLFRLRQYREHGNLFWPDWWGSHLVEPSTMLSVKKELYDLFDLPVPWTKQGLAAAQAEAASTAQQGAGTQRSVSQAGYARLRGLWAANAGGQAPGVGGRHVDAASLQAPGPGGGPPVATTHVTQQQQQQQQEEEEEEERKQDEADAVHAGPPRFLCTESGQVLIDRSRHMDALVWLWWLMMQPHVTGLTHGDKDLYRVAFGLARKSAAFQQVPIPARCALHKLQHHVTFMGMVQLSPQGRPLFHHRTGPSKYFHEDHDPHVDKLATQTVDVLTSPLSHHSAYTMVGRWFWTMGMVDVDPWDRKMCAAGPSGSLASAGARRSWRGLASGLPGVVERHAQNASTMLPQAASSGDVPEAWCRKLLGGLPLMSAWPLGRFGERGRVIELAHQLMVHVARTQPELLAG